jgi:hypothetical protein
LLLTAHAKILLNSTLAMFSASRVDSAFIIITKSSANTTAFVWFVYFNVRREFYCMFHTPGPQYDPWGQPLVMFFSVVLLLSDITALLSEIVLCKLVKILGALGVS